LRNRTLDKWAPRERSNQIEERGRKERGEKETHTPSVFKILN
jgi:hypothetical protein